MSAAQSSTLASRFPSPPFDARAYVLALPEDRQSDPPDQAGIEAILMAAEGKGPMLLAQSGVAHIVHGPVKSLNCGKPDRPWLNRSKT